MVWDMFFLESINLIAYIRDLHVKGCSWADDVLKKRTTVSKLGEMCRYDSIPKHLPVFRLSSKWCPENRVSILTNPLRFFLATS